MVKICFQAYFKTCNQADHSRAIDRSRSCKKGRFLRSDLDSLLIDIWKQVDVLLPSAHLSDLPTFGNRLNVYLAIVTTAGYQIMLKRVKNSEYATTLIADAGWKIYAWMIGLASLPHRLLTRDPQKRMDRTLRAMMIFPFSAPGKPGYEVKTRSVKKGFQTHWTHCPPQTFVRNLVSENKDNGELQAFYNSWCLYDWPGASLIANDGNHNHYTRPKTMSLGDKVCDMCWIGQKKTGSGK